MEDAFRDLERLGRLLGHLICRSGLVFSLQMEADVATRSEQEIADLEVAALVRRASRGVTADDAGH
jgi:hypothetical protein